MHLVRGMTSLNTRKQKTRKKNARLLKAESEHNAFLARMGVKGKTVDYRYDKPDLSTGPRVTSDRVAENGAKKKTCQYTGTEIMGYVTTHKSNLMPIRRDNKQAAVDAANMRR